MMSQETINLRVKESQLGKLNEIQAVINTTNHSETIRACIDIAYNATCEDAKYLINFWNIKRSRLLTWLQKQENKGENNY